MGWEEGHGATIIFCNFEVRKFIKMRFGICPISILPVRAAPNHRSEMVNQLLFGETFIIQEAGPDWFFIRGTLDGYEGWVNKGHIVGLEGNPAVGMGIFQLPGSNALDAGIPY